jgi:hypothetical protein
MEETLATTGLVKVLSKISLPSAAARRNSGMQSRLESANQVWLGKDPIGRS